MSGGLARRATSPGPKPSLVFLLFLFVAFKERKTCFPHKNRTLLLISECLPLFLPSFLPTPLFTLFLSLSLSSYLFLFPCLLIFLSYSLFFCLFIETILRYMQQDNMKENHRGNKTYERDTNQKKRLNVKNMLC